jgi:hypothetical protein
MLYDNFLSNADSTRFFVFFRFSAFFALCFYCFRLICGNAFLVLVGIYNLLYKHQVGFSGIYINKTEAEKTSTLYHYPQGR